MNIQSPTAWPGGHERDENAKDHVIRMPALHRVLRSRHPPRDLLPRLLELALHRGDTQLELALVVLEAAHLAAQPPELPAQTHHRRRRRRRAWPWADSAPVLFLAEP